MRFVGEGRITDSIYMLGRKESNVYLLDGGGEFAIIGGGMIHIAPLVEEQLQSLGISPEAIKKIIILHSHFDHCGMVPYLKRKWKWMEVMASERAKDLLSNAKVVESIRLMNALLLEREGIGEEEARGKGLDFPGIDIDVILKEGDRIDVGRLSLEVLEVPGHSSCSIALFEPFQKALFASDAGGIPMGEDVFTAANSNFDKYMESLNRMAGLGAEIHLAEHFGALTGEDAKRFMELSLESAKSTRRLLEDTYKRVGDVKKAATEVTDLLMERLDSDFLPREVIEIVVGQMLRYISKQLS